MSRALLVLGLILLLAPTAAAATASVRVLGGFFDPATLSIAPGDEVTWTNEDSMPHTVTSSWDAGASFDQVLRGGESFTFAFPDVGSFGVHCRPHNGMEMSVSVQAAVEAPAQIAAPVPGLALPLAALSVFAAAWLLRRSRA